MSYAACVCQCQSLSRQHSSKPGPPTGSSSKSQDRTGRQDFSSWEIGVQASGGREKQHQHNTPPPLQSNRLNPSSGDVTTAGLPPSRSPSSTPPLLPAQGSNKTSKAIQENQFTPSGAHTHGGLIPSGLLQRLSSPACYSTQSNLGAPGSLLVRPKA